MRRTFLLFGIATILLYQGCRKDPDFPFTLQGRVVDYLSGDPIEGVVINVSQKYNRSGNNYNIATDTTDKDGVFSIEYTPRENTENYFCVFSQDKRYFDYPETIRQSRYDPYGKKLNNTYQHPEFSTTIKLRRKATLKLKLVNELPHDTIFHLGFGTFNDAEPRHEVIPYLVDDTVVYLTKYPNQFNNSIKIGYREKQLQINKTLYNINLLPWDTTTYTIKY